MRIPRVPVVYLLRATDGILWKIGRSRVVRRRLATIRREMHLATLVHVILTDDAVALEHQLHKQFTAVRDHGEWFRLTVEHVSWLCSQRRIDVHTEIHRPHPVHASDVLPLLLREGKVEQPRKRKIRKSSSLPVAVASPGYIPWDGKEDVNEWRHRVLLARISRHERL